MKSTADVAVIGGGFAGLSLALQIARRRSDLDVVVIDRKRRPAPERTWTVGESFAELGSHYLRDVLGLRDHLEAEQLPKFGLRFFVGAQPDFADRFELGVLSPIICDVEDGQLLGLPLRTHQVDRARLENEMARRCEDAGVRLIEGTRVGRIDIDAAGHRVCLEGDEASELRTRWIVWASGSTLAGHGLGRRALGHATRAAWTRVEGELDVGAWSAAPAYATQTLPGFRRLSTNHLMGRGYWIWLIPLPSGVTSVGVVADPRLVEFQPRDYAEMLAWIAERDPRLAEELSATRPVQGDFHVVDAEAWAVPEVFGDRRWAVVGQAAGFVDVLYSPGADLVALGNTLLTDLIANDVGTRGGARGYAIANRIFQGFVDGLAEIYSDQYGNFGTPEVVGTKMVWDSAVYFGFNTLLFRHGLSADARFLSTIQPELLTLRSLQRRVQGRLRRGEIQPLLPGGDATVEWGSIDWLMDAYYGAEAQPDQNGVVAHLRGVLDALEGVAKRIEGVA
ncbi:MAG TPA: FAD-dependent oxidoreductase [Longimicrobiales bacterium]|nr:FAD-dependent oxidoreductase [Longimicrobiales bacterium]